MKCPQPMKQSEPGRATPPIQPTNRVDHNFANIHKNNNLASRFCKYSSSKKLMLHNFNGLQACG
jgi:hypothetical protein